MVRTFSRSQPEGWRLRSVLERYDFELGFRTEIAQVAQQQTGHPERDPAPVVRPIVNRECGRCHWWEHCRPQLHPDDVSLRIDKGALDMREIVTLRRHGIDTVTDLARVDLDELLEWYLPEVTHRSGAEGRLRTAVRRATMLAGRRLVRAGDRGPDRHPGRGHRDRLRHRDRRQRADLSLGLPDPRIRTSRGRAYTPSSAASPIWTNRARPRWRWRPSVGCAAWSRAGGRVVVYHYSGYEVAMIRALADREDDWLLDWAAAYAEEHFVDLLEIVKTHYFGVAGLGLKLMAQHAGFRWRDDDPGGLNSQRWFAEAVHGEDAEVRSAGAAAGAGLQRGRRAGHQRAQSVAASAVIAAFRVRRCARSITASTSSMPIGGSASTAFSSSRSLTRW